MVFCMSKLATLEIKRDWQMNHMQTEVSRETMPMMGIFLGLILDCNEFMEVVSSILVINPSIYH